ASKVVLGLDEATPEEAHPHAVDEDARRERVIVPHEPSCEVEPREASFARDLERRQDLRHARRHLVALAQKVAANVDASRSRFAVTLADHHRLDDMATALALATRDLARERLSLGVILRFGSLGMRLVELPERIDRLSPRAVGALEGGARGHLDRRRGAGS